MAAKKKSASKRASKKPAPLITCDTLKDLMKAYAKGTLSRRKDKLVYNNDADAFEVVIAPNPKERISSENEHLVFALDLKECANAALALLKLPVGDA